jgi:hypothetical protein
MREQDIGATDYRLADFRRNYFDDKPALSCAVAIDSKCYPKFALQRGRDDVVFCRHIQTRLLSVIAAESPKDAFFDKFELRQECETRAKAPGALTALAKFVREHSTFFGTRGPNMLTPIARANHQKHIEGLAAEIDALAGEAGKGLADYQQFNDVPGELHAANCFPYRGLVSAAVKALVREKQS